MELKEDTWIWVIVQDPGGNEVFLGQHDEVNDESFIPAFLDKQDALEGLEKLARDREKDYEVQAIRYDLLAGYAEENGFAIFMLNSRGEILNNPAAKSGAVPHDNQ
jgi:hypothetical protein